MVYTNSMGQKYYLHSRPNKLPRNHVPVTTYYFRKVKTSEYCEKLPIHLKVSETRTGLPVVKRI